MSEQSRISGQLTPTKAQHLCVLVHGLWGNPSHLQYVEQSLRERYNEDSVVTLACKRNAGSFTYDGIEIGAERVAREIEEALDQLGRDGYKISKFSIIGYSLGGLVARYVVGLLHHKGYFESIQPVNFTTFASPHLGVRTPLTGYPNHLWNVLGARVLSTSGRQLFMIDNFRNTDRPLLSVLSDPDSIFIQALAKFERRSLYTNIINDRTAVYYTTGVSKTDPYAQLDKLKLNYVDGYGEIILDPDHPCELADEKELPSFYQRVTDNSQTFVRRLPIFLALVILLPIGMSAFLISSCIQTFRSRRRIVLHETDDSDAGFGVYRIPYMVQDMRAGLEDAFENVNSSQRQEYLPNGSEEMAEPPLSPRGNGRKTSIDSSEAEKMPSLVKETSINRGAGFPTLALTPAQFAMIKTLDEVGITKYPVHIRESSHSHAAIIVRSPTRSAFKEGKIVVKHWLDHFVV